MTKPDGRPNPDEPQDPQEDPAGPPANTEHRFHPAVIATAIALPVALIVGVVVAGVIVAGTDDAADTGPVAVSGAVPAPQSGSDSCSTLLAALPDALGDYTRAELADPAPEGAAAWRPESGSDDSSDPSSTEPIVLRCGLDRPAEFRQGVGIQQVDAAQWFEVSGEDMGLASSTWYAVDRPVYVALTLPDGSGPAPIQEISTAITQSLPAQPIDPAPVVGTTGD
ncbi:DUF3515 domain-containing protein [Tomitella fengzijianii]|uniref:DUF3515 domain-containing protein n=1 Tax=Tomitella fengzijianii TaxID=2597660 RepID=A0A516X3S2_9ACTN|nr:DUF3515 domain-containing protein [Tomitella fengzijianii]QDQ97729.1 DUF3515 domain-containing protein [Tomitella fengzijianii]